MQHKRLQFPTVMGGNIQSGQARSRQVGTDTIGCVIGGPEQFFAPVRWAYLCAGGAFVGLGVLGAVLPLMPSTIFFILAVWAFKKSSPRLERKLLEHPVLGPTLRDWDKSKAIKPRTKRLAVATIWLCLGVSALFVNKPYVYAILAATGFALTWYLCSRPEPD